MNDELLMRVRNHVTGCFERDSPPHLLYHNLRHTETVVAHALEIAGACGPDEDKKFILLAAAWFHDIGHLYTSPENHEEKSVLLMQEFLEGDCSKDVVEEIKCAILATRYPTFPSSPIEEIICDADTYHLGTPEFFTTDQLVKKEVEMRTGVVFYDWEKRSLNLLKVHRFYTSYCKNLLSEGKKENIALLEAKLQ